MKELEFCPLKVINIWQWNAQKKLAGTTFTNSQSSFAFRKPELFKPSKNTPILPHHLIKFVHKNAVVPFQSPEMANAKFNIRSDGGVFNLNDVLEATKDDESEILERAKLHDKLEREQKAEKQK